MEFSSMGEKELRRYLDFLLGQYRLVDAFWFLAVEETFGTEAAVKLNEEVWIRIAPLAAREIRGPRLQGMKSSRSGTRLCSAHPIALPRKRG
jgi:hypothetical protein